MLPLLSQFHCFILETADGKGKQFWNIFEISLLRDCIAQTVDKSVRRLDSSFPSLKLFPNKLWTCAMVYFWKPTKSGLVARNRHCCLENWDTPGDKLPENWLEPWNLIMYGRSASLSEEQEEETKKKKEETKKIRLKTTKYDKRKKK